MLRAIVASPLYGYATEAGGLQRALRGDQQLVDVDRLSSELATDGLAMAAATSEAAPSSTAAASMSTARIRSAWWMQQLT